MKQRNYIVLMLSVVSFVLLAFKCEEYDSDAENGWGMPKYQVELEKNGEQYRYISSRHDVAYCYYTPERIFYIEDLIDPQEKHSPEIRFQFIANQPPELGVKYRLSVIPAVAFYEEPENPFYKWHAGEKDFYGICVRDARIVNSPKDGWINQIDYSTGIDGYIVFDRIGYQDGVWRVRAHLDFDAHMESYILGSESAYTSKIRNLNLNLYMDQESRLELPVEISHRTTFFIQDLPNYNPADYENEN